MVFVITITEDADRQLQGFTAREQRIIETAILERLQHEPKLISKSIRELRPNPFAQFELRTRQFRVLYNVTDDPAEVVVLLVGEKIGNKLVVEGVEFHGHEDHPIE